MSTKYGILSLGFIGLLGFGVGLFGYWQTLVARQAMEQSGDMSKIRVLHIMAIVSKVPLYGGLALMIIALISWFLFRRWSRDDQDA